MPASIPGGDTLPWYRQFWPWFLIALPGSVVIASLAMVYIASRGADDLVADDYYRAGLAINERLEAQQRAHALGISVRLRFEADGVKADLTAPGDPEELRLRLSHPMEADRDVTLTLRRIAPGHYAAPLDAAVAPRWHWSLAPPGAEAWRLDGIAQTSDFAGERAH